MGRLRLGEVLFWGATDKPLPRSGVSGGEWVLVVFLCMFGASLHAVRGFNTWWPRNGLIGRAGHVRRELRVSDLAGRNTVSKTPHIVIESFRGNARITGVDTRRR